MSDQERSEKGDLVRAERSDLSHVRAANPLVSRGLMDAEEGRLLKTSETIHFDPRLEGASLKLWKVARVIGVMKRLRSIYLRGVAWLEKLAYDKAIQEFDEAIRIDPSHAFAYLRRGEAYWGKEARWDLMGSPPEVDFERAISDWRNAIRLFNDAIRLFDEAIRIDPNNAVAYLNRGKAWLGKDGASLANDEVESGKEFDNAIHDFDEAIRIDPKNADAYLHRGKAWLDKRDPDKAIRDLGMAIGLDPECGDAFKYRACAWSANKDYDKAIEDYDEAIRLDPTSAFLYYLRGKAWLDKRDHERAIRDLNEAIRQDPNNLCAYCSRAYIGFEKKDYDMAIKDYDEVIRIDPRCLSAYNGRASAWSGKKDYDSAIRGYEEAIRLFPDHWDAYGNLAWLLATCPVEKVRDGTRAIQMAKMTGELCTTKDTPPNWVFAYLAAAYAEAGQFDEAVRCQIMALEDPNDQGPHGDEFRYRLELYQKKKPYRESM